MQGRKQYQEKLFFDFRLSDRVPEDNFYRRLDRCLDLSFLYQATAEYYGKEGNASLDPVVFFKLLLTGYLENLQSDRQIIENARLRLDILLFIGYGLDEELPWHSTLSRTRQLYGEEVFQQLFGQVLGLCVGKGMVAGKRQAIDSVLVKANASLDSLVHKEILEDAAAYVATLEQAAKEEAGWKEARVVKLPSGKKSNRTRCSTTDPDARIATKPGKPRQMNYLGQVSVDTAHHVITNIEAHQADRRDSECLEQVLRHTVENLSAHGLEVAEVLADANYSSADALKAAEQRQIVAYIPNCGQYKSHREGFTYEQEGDYYQCRQGAKLVFRRVRSIRGGTGQMRNYTASAKDCQNCPFRSGCVGKGSYKTLSHTVDKALFDKMQERMQTGHARRLRRQRKSTVEPVIGSLSQHMGLGRAHSRGLAQANKVMLSAAIAYNLKKYLKWIGKKPSVAIALPKAKEKVQQSMQQVLLRSGLDRKIGLCQVLSRQRQPNRGNSRKSAPARALPFFTQTSC